MYRPTVEVERTTPGGRLATKEGANMAACFARVLAATAVAIGLFTTATMPAADAQNDQLAQWLSKAFVPVSTIHQAEGVVIPASNADPVDTAKLKQGCQQLNDAKIAFQGVLPSPDPKLTAEVQQAVDNFETAATENCDAVIAWKPDPNKTRNQNDEDLYNLVSEFQGSLQAGEQHLASADTILAGIAAKG